MSTKITPFIEQLSSQKNELDRNNHVGAIYRPPLEIRESNSSEGSVFNIFHPTSNYSSNSVYKKPDFTKKGGDKVGLAKKESNPTSSL